MAHANSEVRGPCDDRAPPHGTDRPAHSLAGSRTRESPAAKARPPPRRHAAPSPPSAAVVTTLRPAPLLGARRTLRPLQQLHHRGHVRSTKLPDSSRPGALDQNQRMHRSQHTIRAAHWARVPKPRVARLTLEVLRVQELTHACAANVMAQDTVHAVVEWAKAVLKGSEGFVAHAALGGNVGDGLLLCGRFGVRNPLDGCVRRIAAHRATATQRNRMHVCELARSARAPTLFCAP